MASSRFEFPGQHLPATNRFKFGDPHLRIGQFSNQRPVFAFDYLSLRNHEYSFFHPNVTTSDYQKILRRLHELSKITLQVLADKRNELHFHEVNIQVRADPTLSQDLADIFEIEFSDIMQAPALYQVEVYTDNKKDEGPRLIGFFAQGCEFHVIWFDRNHKLFPRSGR
jgi:hypothetical protein